jgi:hypothetical protein
MFQIFTQQPVNIKADLQYTNLGLTHDFCLKLPHATCLQSQSSCVHQAHNLTRGFGGAVVRASAFHL